MPRSPKSPNTEEKWRASWWAGKVLAVFCEKKIRFYHFVLASWMVDCHPCRSASLRISRTTVVNILINRLRSFTIQMYHHSTEANFQFRPEDVQIICRLELNYCWSQSSTEPGVDVSNRKFAFYLKSCLNDVSGLI